MRINYLLAFVTLSVLSCSNEKQKNASLNLEGSWQLISATTIEKGKTQVTNYDGDVKMIKIINGSHFAFLRHSSNPKDTTNFDAGGGSYTLSDDDYTEHLDFYKDKKWEGKTFNFKIALDKDTLIQKGVEKVVEANIDRVIIEKYLKIKP
ncbi:hypothetical protein [Pedobacter sp. CFBP9032]|uniref:hypothetical protein n=1 Tax=Pedobacter sp. CFBP9032 TaxID=3096539 RepID=UPI002A6ADCFE|nr:hypothetical protein [Pedobacter sp. CFBP9032]MDY0904867.1 hypothetical protein [Pedobacter sp. CFBP9032]